MRLPLDSPARRIVCHAALAACLVAGPAIGHSRAQSAPVALNAWLSNDGAKFTALEDLLRGSASRGWLESRSDYVDFRLQLDFRAIEPRSEGAVLVRAWDGSNGAMSGYRVLVGDLATEATRTGAVGLRGKKSRLISADRSALARVAAGATPAAWHRLEITCAAERLTASIDGIPLTAIDATEPLAGYVGLEVSRGVMEFRAVTIAAPLPGPSPTDVAPPAFRANPNTSSLVYPKLLREVKPRYARDAMRRKVEGVLVLDAIVGIDGRVTSAVVSRSLDRKLDAQGVGAARRWRFEPGLKDGVPVPVLVTIELSFVLR